MSSFKKIDDLQSTDTLTEETEFIVIDKSITSGEDATPAGKTTKVTFAEISSSLKDSSHIQGTKGDTGDQGPAGSPGEKGEKGAKGITGQPGQQGYAGTIGPDGTMGEVGLIGDAGSVGITGDSGKIGRPGLPGPRGNPGVKGSRGDVGFIGAKGQPGPIGNHGLPGEDGQTGQATQFIKGQKGRKGVKGFGRRGLEGDKGDQGQAGEKGSRGEKGYQGHDKNIVMSATDLSGTDWGADQTDQLYLDIRTAMTRQTSRVLIKVKRGKYYDRFVLNKDAYAELGTQLYDPLRNSSTPLHQYVYDNVSDILRPMIVTTEEHQRVDSSDSVKKLVYNNYISIRVFYDGEFKRIPFTTWNSDTF